MKKLTPYSGSSREVEPISLVEQMLEAIKSASPVTRAVDKEIYRLKIRLLQRLRPWELIYLNKRNRPAGNNVRKNIQQTIVAMQGKEKMLTCRARGSHMEKLYKKINGGSRKKAGLYQVLT